MTHKLHEPRWTDVPVTPRPDLWGWADAIAFNPPAPESSYYPGKKDHHKRVTTEHTEEHGKGKLIRILFSVYFGGFRG
jgi:hypothetical protein